MISQIYGKIVQRKDNALFIDVCGIVYEVLMPTAIISRINENLGVDGTVRLVTYHYLNVEPSRSRPFLIGFLNEVEKEFFEQFISVSGIGPKAALRAINKPISVIAAAIDNADMDLLRGLPGIGPQRAKDIVAKLQGKIGKFGLLQDRDGSILKGAKKAGLGFEEEALDVLIQLQYKRQEAKDMLQKAVERNPNMSSAEELLNEIYRQKSDRPCIHGTK